MLLNRICAMQMHPTESRQEPLNSALISGSLNIRRWVEKTFTILYFRPDFLNAAANGLYIVPSSLRGSLPLGSRGSN